MHKHAISFHNAFSGIWTALTSQVNLRIHMLIGSLALLASVYLELDLTKILIIILTTALVLTTELVNTAVEAVCDAVTSDHNPNIKIAKDVAAGAVLISAIFSIIIGIIIFVPAFL